MADKPRKPSKPEDQPTKKAADTVQLTAEDLKKISGGVTVPTTGVQPQIKKG
jgi:hypothetical protein